ncbi:MAG: acyl-CoA synthetase FdrA [Alphaproteobacteria bacterium]|nr:acyl-CoA synthetase FdrA [Alphaproteobacteria bacterium]
MEHTLNKVFQGFYKDSVALMRLSRDLAEMAGVNEAALMMGSPSNKQILKDAGLLADDGAAAEGGDLILAVRAIDASAAQNAANAIEPQIKSQTRTTTGDTVWQPQTIRAAAKANPDANLALISVPGEFAAAEARKAISRGLHVMMFSDNVSIEDEISLKTQALEQNVLMMGPDCGTAILEGVPLAFANNVTRGDVGIVGASGTGIQEVTSLISNNGGGISHAIGVGGRDLKDEIGGISTLMGIDRLDDDAETKHIVLISKPPGKDVLPRVMKRIKQSPKPFTVCFIGATDLNLPANATAARTLKDAAQTALGGKEFEEKISSNTSSLGGRTKIRGLYSGGTLAAETQVILLDAGLEVASNAAVPGAKNLTDDGDAHQIIDLGDDQFTQGRPHPMIDPEIRKEPLADALADNNVGVILIDIVIGYGAHPDLAGQLADMLSGMQGENDPIIIASVTGTEQDPQVRSSQISALQAAGIHVAGSNADAAIAALDMLGINS